MDGVQDKVRSLWVPLREMNLLLPNVAVAEIGSYRVPEAQADMPEWFLGMVKWREQRIPVISLEAVCGLSVPSNPVFSRLMIVNSVCPGSAIKHYAVVTAGLPGLILLAMTRLMKWLRMMMMPCSVLSGLARRKLLFLISNIYRICWSSSSTRQLEPVSY